MQPEAGDWGRLSDMLEAARAVARFVRGKSFEEYTRDEVLMAAVERKIEIVGEAARGVSQTFRDTHPEIPWRPIMAQRHILAHEYGEIKQERIWDVATVHMPALIHRLDKLIPPPPPD